MKAMQIGDVLIVTMLAAPADADLLAARQDLAERIGDVRARGVVIDVSAMDVIDSFATRTIAGMAQVARLRGADTIVVGIQPEVAFAMVQLGITFEQIATAIDLDEGLAALAARRLQGPR